MFLLMQFNSLHNDTICAIATPHGMGAIATIRISGNQTFTIVASLFQQNDKPLDAERIVSHKAYHGYIVDNKELIDEVLVTFFRAPHSFTGEDSAEISVHGSVYIQQKMLQILIAHGCRMADAGEFTRRAFINGKFDLAQAEAIADLISSENEAMHRVAINQLKGGFSKELQMMRSKLLEMTSLIELELDFSEEDVEFADRKQLMALLEETQTHVNRLKDSFRLGNAIKNGVPVAIVGATNTGKSTLLNALLQEDRAIVSDIAGTTRDSIEEVMNLNGTLFRFIDTAGIRETDEAIEKIGIERTFRKIGEADIVLGMIDMTQGDEAMKESARLILEKTDTTQQTLLFLLNKSDCCPEVGTESVDVLKNMVCDTLSSPAKHIYIQTLSAKTGQGLEKLRHTLEEIQKERGSQHDATLVSNIRHYEALNHTSKSLSAVEQGLNDGIPSDLVAQDLRAALYYLGTITGEITTDEVLGSVFSRFCIGK